MATAYFESCEVLIVVTCLDNEAFTKLRQVWKNLSLRRQIKGCFDPTRWDTIPPISIGSYFGQSYFELDLRELLVSGFRGFLLNPAWSNPPPRTHVKVTRPKDTPFPGCGSKNANPLPQKPNPSLYGMMVSFSAWTVPPSFQRSRSFLVQSVPGSLSLHGCTTDRRRCGRIWRCQTRKRVLKSSF